MSSANGRDGPIDLASSKSTAPLCQTIECQLFESLVHHLIEKGVLTRNDALSVVQTVAQVHRGQLEEQQPGTVSANNGLAILKRLYSSFELMSDRHSGSAAAHGENVLQLRPPLHDNRPDFYRDD
jgi:hypothetical protein